MRKIKITHSDVYKFRKKWEKKGYELINITELCEVKLGCNGWINNLNEPDEKSYHIQIWYRDEQVAVITPNESYVIDSDKYILYTEEDDFIIFRKVKINE